MNHTDPHDTSASPAEQWDERYRESERTWSGRVNQALADSVAELTPGRALDIGCGEGADAIWLAERGWRVDGLDISPTAVARAEAAAQAAGVDDVTFHAGSLIEWATECDETFKLVTAMFLHVRDGQDRAALLRAASSLVAPGGRLLVVSHASPPPWARFQQHDHDHDHEPITPADDRALLGHGEDHDAMWIEEIAEVRSRPAVGPDGEHAVLDDSVLLLRRTRA